MGSGIPSPTHLTAHLVGVLTVVVFIFGILNGHAYFAGVAAGIGIVVFVVLRVLRPILDPLFVWLVARQAQKKPEA